MRNIKRATLGITADGDSVVGAVLLVDLAGRLGLPGVLDRRWWGLPERPGRAPRPARVVG